MILLITLNMVNLTFAYNSAYSARKIVEEERV